MVLYETYQFVIGHNLERGQQLSVEDVNTTASPEGPNNRYIIYHRHHPSLDVEFV